MNTLIRGLGLGVVLSAALILSGCSADNETEANKLQAGTGAAPTPEKGSTKDTGPQAKTYDDYVKQQQSNNMYSGGNYPGATGGAAPKAAAPATKK